MPRLSPRILIPPAVVVFACACSTNASAPDDLLPEHTTQDNPEIEIPAPAPPADPWYPTAESEGDFYTAEYVNLVLVASDGAGRNIVLVAGRHSAYQPYFDKKEPWDDVHCVVDGTACNAHGAQLAGFEVAFDDAEGWVEVFLDLDMTCDDLGATRVKASLPMQASFHDAQLFGIDLSAPDSPALGMLHRPAFLSLDPEHKGVFSLGEEPLETLETTTGEFELGHINYVTDPGMAWRYDYACLICPEDGWVYLHFQGHALNPEGPFGEMFEQMVLQNMRQEVTLRGPDIASGNPYGLPDTLFTTAGDILINHVEDVGLAYMDRQVVQMQTPGGCQVSGLRELLTAK